MLLLALIGVVAPEGRAQRVDRIPPELLREVMPEAERFSEASGDPPVVSAYGSGDGGGESLLGYVFLTSDLPPEQYGYSGPIEALVGMLPDGTLSGVRVTDYRESYMRSMGDFLRTPGFQEQFAGKHIGDPFQLWGDVEGISRVSISVRALSRGVRDAARRVANAYGLVEGVAAVGTVVDPIGMSWFELRQAGVVERFEVTEPGEGSAGIALTYLSNERLGRYLLGEPLYERALRSVERRGGAEHLVLYAIDGSRLRLFRQQGWSIEQDGDTTQVDTRNVVSLGVPSGGVVSGEATMVGLMLLDDSVDPSRAFTFVYDLGEWGVHTVDYLSPDARLLLAEQAAGTEAVGTGPERSQVGATAAGRGAEMPEVAPEEGSPAESEGADAVPDEVEADELEVLAAEPEALADEPEVEDPTAEAVDDFVVSEDESILERTLSGTSWGRVATIAGVLALATFAFFLKTEGLRWLSLGVTLVVLGFLDGGFLSVSHVTGAIWAGLGVFARDLPLLLVVVFTVVTTLVWGRVLCGFLCPFGALQDVIDRVAPRRLRRELPPAAHDRAKYGKYAVLAVVVLPPMLGSRVSLHQYVEPFGTVFFLSSSVLLWTLAAAFLVASAVVPRFYCRYACPLGAALALVSVVAPRRIERVPHCVHCEVCEQRCPTGAIRGERIDFPECVRCNVCEVALIEEAGVCRHDLEDVRSRLVQIRLAGAGAAGGGVDHGRPA